MSNVKILVCAHKEDYVYEDEVFTPIQVGKAISKFDLGFWGDDTGDNISSKNESYCELTALYWAWKNLHDVDYIGLCHYRRYFAFDQSARDLYKISPEEFSLVSQGPKSRIEKMLKRYDIIIAKPIVYPYNLFVDYSVCHLSEDMRTLENVVNEIYPEYGHSFNKVMKCNNKLSHYNMFICKWELFDDYCTWLFNILTEVEKRIDTTNYNSVQKRIYGYMAERLLNIYIEKHKTQICYRPIYFICNKKNTFFIKYLLKRLRTNISFFFNRPLR